MKKIIGTVMLALFLSRHDRGNGRDGFCPGARGP